jgi:hypothetical protein
VGETAMILSSILQLFAEGSRAIAKWNELTEGGKRDLTPEQLASFKQDVDDSFARFQQILKDRGID